MKKKISFAIILIFMVLLIAGCQNNDKMGLIFITDEKISKEGYIGFSVYGKDGEEIIKDAFVFANYKKNITVADLSRDICRELKIPVVFDGAGPMTYLKGINNLFEFDHGALSGWIYFVNGESQGAGCGAYIVQDGDYVEWKYTLDLGKDIGADFNE